MLHNHHVCSSAIRAKPSSKLWHLMHQTSSAKQPAGRLTHCSRMVLPSSRVARHCLATQFIPASLAAGAQPKPPWHGPTHARTLSKPARAVQDALNARGEQLALLVDQAAQRPKPTGRATPLVRVDLREATVLDNPSALAPGGGDGMGDIHEEHEYLANGQ